MRNEIRNTKYEIRKKQSGQVIIILLMLMLVALSIILAVTQRSVTDVNTSTQAEQSTRAYSAAEAGIEKALTGTAPAGTQFDLGNNSSALINQSGLLPYDDGTFAGIEYPPIGRETTAHFWFVDPASTATPPVAVYNASRVDLYYGNDGTTDLPAVEVRIVMFANSGFHTYTKYYDSSGTRTSGPNDNNFDQTTTCGGLGQTLATGILGNNHVFYCKQTIPSTTTDIPKLGGGSGNCTPSNGCTLILARVRLLYVNENHKIALAPPNPNPTSAKFPPQVQIYNSVGTSGQSQKQIQAFRVKDVIPPWFDFALFSTDEIRK